MGRPQEQLRGLLLPARRATRRLTLTAVARKLKPKPTLSMDKVDEDLNQLEKDIRQLKIEFEQYFGGGRKRAPTDTQWRVESLIRRYSERIGQINYGQRFRYNNMASTYAKYVEMWRKKLAQKESGAQQHHYGAAAKAIEAERARMRAAAEEHGPAQLSVAAAPPPERPAVAQQSAFAMQISNPKREIEKVHELYAMLIETRLATGEKAGTPSLEDFEQFVQKKTQDLQKKGGQDIEYSVSVEGGKVKLKARVAK